MLRKLLWTSVFVAGLAGAYQYGKKAAEHKDLEINTVKGQNYLMWKSTGKTYQLHQFGEDLYMGGKEHQLKGAYYLLQEQATSSTLPATSTPPQKQKQATLKEQIVKEFEELKEKALELKEELW
jgi:hypothetical protein